MRRALVLAGGGAKIGWAAGALEVLLDEAGLRFDHIDATSGSVFNLGMLLSGRSGAEISAAWSDLEPREFLSFHRPWRYLAFWRLPSLVTQQAIRHRIMPKWGIDLERIRACTEVYGHPVVGTFNVCDFGTKRVETIPHREMDEDWFLAVDAVPGVVPPVEKNGTRYVDAMLLQDANITEAVQRGADEIWVIWTVEDTVEWKGGSINHFGHVFEICALGNLWRELDTVEAENLRRVDQGQPPITVHLLRPSRPIPVGYLFYRSKKQMAPIVESGREAARTYLRDLRTHGHIVR